MKSRKTPRRAIERKIGLAEYCIGRAYEELDRDRNDALAELESACMFLEAARAELDAD